jgi:phage terminase large subunit-like protein
MTEDVYPSPYPGPQRALYECDAEEVLYGGAKGGGKSYGLLLKAVRTCMLYGRAEVVILRKTHRELQPLIKRSQDVFRLFGATYRDSGLNEGWTFPNGARVMFGYLDGADGSRWQGANVSTVMIDEAGSIGSWDVLLNVKKEMRSAHGVPQQFIMTANPAGPGEQWLMERYITDAQPVEVGGVECFTKEGRLFIPARITDNPSLAEYEDRLRRDLAGNDRLLRALLYGEWGIPIDAKIFKHTAFTLRDNADVPERWQRRIWSWDTAFSTSKSAACSAGVCLGLADDGSLWVVSARKGRMEWDDLVLDIIAGTHEHYADYVLIEAQANGRSLAQHLKRRNLETRLFNPQGMTNGASENAKAARHTLSMMTAAQVGSVNVRAFPERDNFLHELYTQPDNPLKDWPDAFAQGVLHLLQSPERREGPVFSSESMDIFTRALL